METNPNRAFGVTVRRLMMPNLLFATVLVLTSVMSVAAVFLLAAAFKRAPKVSYPKLDTSSDAAFLFDGTTLIDATPSASALIEAHGPADTAHNSPWDTLMRYLQGPFPSLSDSLDPTLLNEHFVLTASDDSGLQLRGERVGGALRLTVIDTLKEDSNVTLDRLSYKAMQDELGLLRRLTESAPMMLWREDATGAITWANDTYLSHCSDTGTIGWPLPALFPKTDSTSDTERVSLPGLTPTQSAWFDVTHVKNMGDQLNYAIPADEAYEADRAKHEFIQTLTKTFSTLPIGLAVFDHLRRLHVFNPALTDLTGLEPEFLLSRPGLEGFLNRMREKYVLPEPRDYHSWSRRLLDIENAAEDSNFEETWSLPTGQTYRVSARPHPDGALAFLIEDITSETHLTRNFRAGMETSQSVLNQLETAICVFATNGELILTNAAFSQLWTLEGEESLTAVTLGEAIENWRESGNAPQLWDQIAALAKSGVSGQSHMGEMTLTDGETLGVEARRLNTGALMISFDELSRAIETTPRAQVLRASA